MVFIDGLRAFACLSVVVYHFYAVSVLHGPLARWVPAPLEWVLARSKLGVDVFFVISGFVIAHSVRSARLNPSFVANFAVRRSIRLDPPYWAAMALSIAVGAPRALRVTGSALPTTRQLLRNVFYLQELTHSHRILDVSWTLCFEVQFYIVLILSLAAAQWLAARSRFTVASVALAITWPVSLATLAVPAGRVSAVPGLFVNQWYGFYLGVLARRALSSSGRSRGAWFWTYAAAAAATLRFQWDWAVVTALATALLIYAVGRLGRLGTALRWRPVQVVGRASYSIYLVHGVFAVAILDYGRRRTGDAVLPAVGWELLALGLTAVTSWLMFRYVERPATQLAAGIKGVPLSAVQLRWPVGPRATHRTTNVGQGASSK